MCQGNAGPNWSMWSVCPEHGISLTVCVQVTFTSGASHSRYRSHSEDGKETHARTHLGSYHQSWGHMPRKTSWENFRLGLGEQRKSILCKSGLHSAFALLWKPKKLNIKNTQKQAPALLPSRACKLLGVTQTQTRDRWSQHHPVLWPRPRGSEHWNLRRGADCI